MTSTPMPPPPTADGVSRQDVCIWSGGSVNGKSGRRAAMAASPKLAKKVMVSHCEAVQIFDTTVAQMGRDDEGYANDAAFPPAPLSLSRYPRVSGKCVTSSRYSRETVKGHVPRERTGMTPMATAMQLTVTDPNAWRESLDRCRECREVESQRSTSGSNNHGFPKEPPAIEESPSQLASRVAVVEVVRMNTVDWLSETVGGVGPASAVASFGARTGVRPLKRPSHLTHPSLTIVSLREDHSTDRNRNERTDTFVLSTCGRMERVESQRVACTRSGRPESRNKNSRARNGRIAVEDHSVTPLTPVRAEMRGDEDRRTNDAKPVTGVAGVSTVHEKELTDQSTETLTNGLTQSTVLFDPANVRLSMKGTTKQATGELVKTMFDEMHYAEFEHNKFRRRPLKKSKTSIRSYETGSRCTATKITGNDNLDKRKA